MAASAPHSSLMIRFFSKLIFRSMSPHLRLGKRVMRLQGEYKRFGEASARKMTSELKWQVA